LTAWEEDKHVVGQANIQLDETVISSTTGNAARKAGEFILAQRDEIEFVDVSAGSKLVFSGCLADSVPRER